jgi:hypothetical protein
MQPYFQSAPTPLSAADESTYNRKNEDLIYQAVTVAAMLLVLGSLWVF